jgi:hypothetical protein
VGGCRMKDGRWKMRDEEVTKCRSDDRQGGNGKQEQGPKETRKTKDKRQKTRTVDRV